MFFLVSMLNLLKMHINLPKPYSVKMQSEGYGGIWVTGKPFQINLKCVVIGIMAACIYALPRFSAEGNLFMMAFIFAITYILISLYDYWYNCTPHMYSRGISPTAIFKPQYMNENIVPPPGEEFALDQNKMYMRSVYWAHAAIIAPIFLYGSWRALSDRKKGYERDNASKKGRDYSIYPIMFGLSMLAGFYHAIRIFYPRDACVKQYPMETI